MEVWLGVMLNFFIIFFTKFKKITKHYFPPPEFHIWKSLRVTEVISIVNNIYFFICRERTKQKPLCNNTECQFRKKHFQMWEISRQYTVFFFFLFSSFPGGVLRYKSLDTRLCCFIHKRLVSSLLFTFLRFGSGELASRWERVPFFPS